MGIKHLNTILAFSHGEGIFAAYIQRLYPTKLAYADSNSFINTPTTPLLPSRLHQYTYSIHV